MRRMMIIGLLLPLLFSAFQLPERDKTYSNPVLVETYEIKRPNPAPYSGTLGIGDPTVIYHSGKYYLYPTGDNRSYDVYISNDLVRWTKGPKVFQSSGTGLWAPDVFFSKEGSMFYLYYTINGRIGVAEADRPDGVFRDRGALIGNAIDAHLFRDDNGQYFLYYAQYPDFAIFVQPMESPLRKKGPAVKLISPEQSWEKKDVPVTEAPWMIKHKGVYYLLYSGGSADSEDYAIGYATATHPKGPFTKYHGNPIVSKGNDNGVLGPGHVSVIPDHTGKLWMVYHQQKDKTRGWNRLICIDPIWFDENGVLHAKASRAIPRPAPVTDND